jgi:holo-[acyl-carrier protein] synthase
VIGVGIDIVQVSRIAGLLQKYGDRFRQRCFSEAELTLAHQRGKREAATLAARWAAKEAFRKALGSHPQPLSWHDVEVVHGENGEPRLQLHAAAASALAAAGGSRILLSLSHEHDYAVAVVLLE